MLPPKVLVLILIQFLVQPCYSQKIIRPLNGRMYAELNQNYSLICDFGPRGEVEWEDSDRKIIDSRLNCHSIGQKTTTIFSNAVTHCNNSVKTSTLTIVNVTKDLNGTKVRCISKSEDEEFQIKVHDKPDLSNYIILSFSRKEIYDGQDVEVSCHWNVKTQHIPVDLTCGEGKTIQNGSIVVKLTMTKEWHKKYCKCEAFQSGTRIVTSHQITVHFAPQVYVSNLTAAAGTTAVLNCSVSGGYPETYSYLEWHHFFKTVLVEKRRPSAEDGSLVLSNTTWQDEGTWVCFASNGGYNQSNYGYLTITGPPLLQALNRIVEAVPGTNKKLEVQIFPFYDTIDITWKHNGKKISKGTPGKLSSAWQQQVKGHGIYLSGLTASLTLNDIQDKDAGRYSIQVGTRDGISLYDFQMKISVAKSKMTFVTVGLICGMSAIFLMCIIIGCFYFCYRRNKRHPTLIGQPMSTPRTRIFSLPRKDSFDSPTSNFEMEIYEEIKDYSYDDHRKKEDDQKLLQD